MIQPPATPAPKKTSKWVWIVLAVLILAGVGSYLGNKEKDATQAVYTVTETSKNSTGDTVVKVNLPKSSEKIYEDVTEDLWVKHGSVRVMFSCTSTSKFIAQTSQSSALDYSGRTNSSMSCG